MIALETLSFLTSPAGARALAWLAQEDLSDENSLRLLMALRRDHAPAEAGAALELARLRRAAVAKFGSDAAHLYFTREGLEQASDPRIRRWRAAESAGLRVVDACCGIGADSLAYAAAGALVTGIDRDPLRTALARLNAAALNLDANFETGDVRDALPAADLIFFDPARRSADGRRIFSVESYEPPLSTLQQWRAPCIRVKLAPGVKQAEIAPYSGMLIFISVAGELKEALLDLGGETGTAALLFHDEQIYHWGAADVAVAPISAPRAYLIEPDPALIRAGLVAAAALRWEAAQLDPTTAYLTADAAPETPWARAWRIEGWLPFNVKALRATLRERDVGRVAVKKRGTAVTPEALIPQLKLKGGQARTLVLTRWQGRQIVLICEEMPEAH
ncbi:MAG: class I SAM-dependent methyltransferase [Aggregatilineales bacterium]